MVVVTMKPHQYQFIAVMISLKLIVLQRSRAGTIVVTANPAGLRRERFFSRLAVAAVADPPNDSYFNTQWALQSITPWGTHIDAVWRYMATAMSGPRSVDAPSAVADDVVVPSPSRLLASSEPTQAPHSEGRHFGDIADAFRYHLFRFGNPPELSPPSEAAASSFRDACRTDGFRTWCADKQQDTKVRKIEVDGRRGRRPVVVAVIDAGCDLSHPDLRASLWRNTRETDCFDGIDDDGNGFVDDCYGWDFVANHPIRTPRWADTAAGSPAAAGRASHLSPTLEMLDHGTQAASVLGAATNNSLGITGACLGRCQLMCLRAMIPLEEAGGEASGQRVWEDITEARLVRALHYAQVMGANISTHGYGRYGAPFHRLHRYINNLTRQQSASEPGGGHLLVTAAGNHGINLDSAYASASDVYYPAGHSTSRPSSTLVVGASNHEGQRASFSSFGNLSVDLFAPGVLIAAATAGGGIDYVSGTSTSGPLVAGAAALLWSLVPDLTAREVRERLLASVTPSPFLQNACVSGGTLNVWNALRQSS